MSVLARAGCRFCAAAARGWPWIAVAALSWLGGCRPKSVDFDAADEAASAPNGSRKVRVVFDNGGPVAVDPRGPTAAARMPAAASAHPPSQVGASLSWDVPTHWKKVAPASPMRLAQYQVPHSAGDDIDAELAVFYFGPSGAGSHDETMMRWVSTFDPESAARAVRSSRTIGAMDVKFVEVSGTYDAAKAMVNAPASDASARSDSSLLGAIVQAVDGPYYFKLIGPRKTVSGARTDFEKLIASCRPSQSLSPHSVDAGASAAPSSRSR
jgi:hypothetical protein